jgi:signal transduction histidine kinase
MQAIRIIVVEDEVIAATFIKRVLKDFGYEVIGHFSSAEAAITFLEEHPVELVLMDIVLEGQLDGIDAAAIITRKFDIPVLYLTSYSDEQKLERAIATEPFGYILKPINERELHANIKMTFFKHQLERRLHTYVKDLEDKQSRLELQAQQLIDLNHRLQESETHLKSLNDSKDKLFSIIAHDLRSPFNVLLGYSEYLAEDVKNLDISVVQKIATEMHISLKNVYTMLDNLLEWARIQTGRVEFQPELINCSKVITPILELLEPGVRQKELTVEVDLSESDEIFADMNMLSSAIQNLLTNAIKFTPRKGKVEIKYGRNEDTATITVADNGIGMSEDTKASLFKLGTNPSTYGTENEPGTGLGLLLVNECVTKCGGKLRLTSKEGNGSSLTIELPFPKKEILENPAG